MARQSKPKILVVDDDPVFRASVRIILDQNKEHWSTFAATSVETARTLIQHQQFQLAILDVHLPDGTAADVVATAGILPCILCTQDNKDTTFREMFENQELAHNIVGYLPKPINRDAIWAIRAGLLIAKSRRRREELTGEATARLEQEKGDISRTLHDSMGAAFTQLSWKLGEFNRLVSREKDTSPALREAVELKFAECKEIIKRAQREVSAVVRDLRPEELDIERLAKAIKSMIKDWKVAAPTVKFLVRIDDDIHLVDRRREASVFRLVQEGITNVMRHSAPTRVTTTVRQQHGQLYIQVLGRGSIPARENESYPLTVLRERTAGLGGLLTFECDTTTGVSNLQIRIPIELHDVQ